VVEEELMVGNAMLAKGLDDWHSLLIPFAHLPMYWPMCNLTLTRAIVGDMTT
jgi:hypothetical protein